MSEPKKEDVQRILNNLEKDIKEKVKVRCEEAFNKNNLDYTINIE